MHTTLDSFERNAALAGCIERPLGGLLGGLVRPVHPYDVELAAVGIDQRIGFAVEQIVFGRAVFHPRYLGDDLGKAATAHCGNVIGNASHLFT